MSRAHERYRRQTTDGRAIAYSERERAFTFAKNYCLKQNGVCGVKSVVWFQPNDGYTTTGYDIATTKQATWSASVSPTCIYYQSKFIQMHYNAYQMQHKYGLFGYATIPRSLQTTQLLTATKRAL